MKWKTFLSPNIKRKDFKGENEDQRGVSQDALLYSPLPLTLPLSFSVKLCSQHVRWIGVFKLKYKHYYQCTFLLLLFVSYAYSQGDCSPDPKTGVVTSSCVLSSNVPSLNISGNSNVILSDTAILTIYDLLVVEQGSSIGCQNERCQLTVGNASTYATETVFNGTMQNMATFTVYSQSILFGNGADINLTAGSVINLYSQSNIYLDNDSTFYTSNFSILQAKQVTVSPTAIVSTVGSGKGLGVGSPGLGGMYGGATIASLNYSKYTAYGYYGSTTYPTDFGSASYDSTSASGNGGGAILIKATSLAVFGQLLSNGQNAVNTSGSGGSVLLVIDDSIEGDGMIQANSGPVSATQNACGGSGGRIALYYSTNNFTGNITAAGYYNGPDNGVGSPGTIYHQEHLSSGENYTAIYVDGGGFYSSTTITGDITVDEVNLRNKGSVLLASSQGTTLRATKLIANWWNTAVAGLAYSNLLLSDFTDSVVTVQMYENSAIYLPPLINVSCYWYMDGTMHYVEAIYVGPTGYLDLDAHGSTSGNDNGVFNFTVIVVDTNGTVNVRSSHITLNTVICAYPNANLTIINSSLSIDSTTTNATILSLCSLLPSIPQNCSVDAGVTLLNLLWEAPLRLGSTASYQLDIYNASDQWQNVYSGPSLSFQVPGLTANTTYQFRLLAFNFAGASDFITFNGTTQEVPPTPLPTPSPTAPSLSPTTTPSTSPTPTPSLFPSSSTTSSSIVVECGANQIKQANGKCKCASGYYPSGKSCKKTATTVIAVIIPIVAVIALVAIFLFMYKRRKENQKLDDEVLEVPMPGIDHYSHSNLIANFADITITEQLGVGGSGVVSRGVWHHIDVAVKVFNDRNIETTDFIRESQIHAKLHHPNVVQLLAICLQPNLCTITEFMAKGSLTGVIKNKVAFTSRRRIQALMDISKGMDYLHKSSILHRDLKSLNCLVDKNWTCKIADFGTSKMVSVASAATTQVPRTAQWSAPEVILRGEYSNNSDVYSFAVVMWECLTGELPYGNTFAFQIEDSIVKGERLAVPEGCEEWYSTLMQDCWSADPAARPSFDAIIGRLTEHIR